MSESASKALVLLSGGIDSAVAAIIASERHTEISFLTFDYSQLNKCEIEYAHLIAKALEKNGRHIEISLDFSRCVKARRSKLLIEHESDISQENNAKGSYGYYVSGRNMIFLSHAAAVAEVNDIDTLYVGSNIQDTCGPSGGYPDSSPEFITLAEKAINMGLKYAAQLKIQAPLIAMNKFEVIRYGLERKFDFSLTWSCYHNGPKACGRCSACKSRLLNFHWAGYCDPLEYDMPKDLALTSALVNTCLGTN